ncbi:MAG: element excision factor XisH family protein [Prochlorotrichaceae cyanobacterium]
MYQSFFQRRFIQSVIQRTQLKLFTYDETQEVVRQWL